MIIFLLKDDVNLVLKKIISWFKLLKMQKHIEKIQTLIIKQALRDLASVKPKLREESLAFFLSTDFRLMSEQMNIDRDYVVLALKELVEYPIIARKKLVEEMVENLEGIKKDPQKNAYLAEGLGHNTEDVNKGIT